MARVKLTEYSATASSNTELNGISLAENAMTPASVNDAFRENMKQLKDFVAGTTGLDVLHFQDDDASHFLKFQAPSSVTTSTTFTLPDGDGSAGQFLKTDGSATLSWSAVTEFVLPSGLILPFGGAAAPSGYLLCYGQAISRSTYSTLFSAISTTYGVGDGSSTFNLPDLRGRTIAGQDDMGGVSANRLTDAVTGGLNGDTLGDTGGTESHTLTSAQSGLVGHTHGVSASLEAVTGSGTAERGVDTGDSAFQGNNAANNTSMINVSISAVASADASEAHNIVQPTIILNYIIKT